MSALWQAQNFVYMVLGIGIFVASLAAFIDALRYPKEVYDAASKWNKTGWVVVLGLSAAITFATGARLGMFTFIAIVAAGVYFADVRPALKQYAPHVKRRKERSGPSGFGPHGSW